MKGLYPTSYSTLSPDALAATIAGAYDLHDVSCRFLLRGVGDTYLVTAGEQKYILRIYRNTHRDLADIQYETGLLNACREAGVPVSYPILQHNGNMILSFAAAEGERHGVLFSFAVGKAYQQLGDEQLSALGAAMAAFHHVSAAYDPAPRRRVFDFQSTLYIPLQQLAPYFNDDPEGYEWLKDSADYVVKQIEEMDTASFSRGYCHFDFLPKNFHFDDAGRITFFDFDFMGHGWLVNDLMTFWQHLCLDVLFNRITQERADESFEIVVEAYRSRSPLSDDELKAIPFLALGFWLFYTGFHTTHDQFQAFVNEPSQLKHRVSMIRKLLELRWPSGTRPASPPTPS